MAVRLVSGFVRGGARWARWARLTREKGHGRGVRSAQGGGAQEWGRSRAQGSDRVAVLFHTMERGRQESRSAQKEVWICHFISIALSAAAGLASA